MKSELESIYSKLRADNGGKYGTYTFKHGSSPCKLPSNPGLDCKTHSCRAYAMSLLTVKGIPRDHVDRRFDLKGRMEDNANFCIRRHYVHLDSTYRSCTLEMSNYDQHVDGGYCPRSTSFDIIS